MSTRLEYRGSYPRQIYYTTDNPPEEQHDNDYTRLVKYAYFTREPVRWIITTSWKNSRREYFPVSYLIFDAVRNNREGDHVAILLQVERQIILSTASESGVEQSTPLNPYFDVSILVYCYLRSIIMSNAELDESEQASTYELFIYAVGVIQRYAALTTGVSYVPPTIDALMDYIDRYNLLYDQMTKIDENVHETIIDTQTWLNETDVEAYFLRSPQYVINKSYTFYPYFEGMPVSPDVGSVIFDQLIASDRAPYVQYIDSENKMYYKLYKGDEFDRQPNYNSMIIHKERGDRKSTIELTLWLGDKEHTIYNATQESFFRAVFNLETGNLSFRIPIVRRNVETDFEQNAFEILAACFPSLTRIGPDDVLVTDVTTEINLYPREGEFEFLEFAFLDYASMDERYKHIVYGDENGTIYPMRPKFSYMYIEMFSDFFDENVYAGNSAKWSMSFKLKSNDKSYEVETDHGIVPVVGSDIPSERYVLLRISQAKNIEYITTTIDIITRILARFYEDVVLTEGNEVRRLYEDVGKQMGDDILHQEGLRRTKMIKKKEKDLKERTKANRSGIERFDRYRAEYPDIFNDVSLVKCRGYRTPALFKSQAEARQWAGTFPDGRQILRYPSENESTEPYFWFGCPNEKRKYPTIIENPDVATRANVPYFPCCSDKDTINSQAKTDYNRYYNRLSFTGVTKVKKGVTDKLLGYDERAELPTSLKTFLGGYRENAMGNTLVKIGAVRPSSPNSFLHCVLLAIRDSEYIALIPDPFDKNYEQRLADLEGYVSEYKMDILRNVNTNVARQELYDAFDENDQPREFLVDLLKSDSYFDPRWYYRLVEEYFGLNIYLFTTTPESPDGTLAFPRYRQFPVKIQNHDRRTVLIFLNNGPIITRKLIRYPHCELIADTAVKIPDDPRGMPYCYFMSDMEKRCHAAYTMMNSTLTFSKTNSSVRTYTNVYDVIDYRAIFGNSLSAQLIDSYGHTYGFHVELESGETMTVIVPPTQPMNLEVTRIITRVSVAAAKRVFATNDDNNGKMTAVTRDRGTVTGVWFSLVGIIEGLYVPTLHDDIEDVATGRTILADFQDMTSEVERLEKLTKMKTYILQIIRWLFDIQRVENDNDYDVESFIGTYFLYDDRGVDPLDYYDFSNLPYLFPRVSSSYRIEDALESAASWRTNLFIVQDEQVVFRFHNLAFMNKVADYLRSYYLASYMRAPKITRRIEGRYRSHLDFAQVPGVEVFTSRFDFEAWLEGQEAIKGEIYRIRKTINRKDGNSELPFLYEDRFEITTEESETERASVTTNSKVYIIQNVEGHDIVAGQSANFGFSGEQRGKTRALGVSNRWLQNHVNEGFEYDVDESVAQNIESFSRVVTYGISSVDKLIPISDSKGESGSANEILAYAGKDDLEKGVARYAALLPLV